jgi:MinD superfamily P-loop ATPase
MIFCAKQLTWKRHGHSDGITNRQIRSSLDAAVLGTHTTQIGYHDTQFTSKLVENLDERIVQQTNVQQNTNYWTTNTLFNNG